MRGPPVVQKDGPRGPMEPLPRPSLRDRIAALGTAIDLLKRVLFVSLLATVASTKKPVQLFPICVMLALSLLHVLYLRLLGPALALVDSLGEMLSALCDVGTFACGVVVARTPVEQRRKLTILGVCMLACQVLGILCALVPRIVGLCVGLGCWCAKGFGGGAEKEEGRRDASGSPTRFWFGRRKTAKHSPIILDHRNIVFGSARPLEPSAPFAAPPPPPQPSQEAVSKAARWASIGRAGKRPFAPFVEPELEPEPEPEQEQEPSSSQPTPEAKVPKDAAARKREAMQRLRAALGGAPCEGPPEEQGEELIPGEFERSESRNERLRDVRSGARSTPSASVRRLFSSPLKKG
ncbi:hypothetical protein H632_c3205p0 [Helicosporidium sp. ATCC 50920]|nr:hypothetical protein H632_c3205p0 [Helicosporidium sp. ATCC 50920]|eukprot:KDD72546.1 hypothetical protein H632_c3205p0 [Helicosporidium sp. ATCC 50920]